MDFFFSPAAQVLLLMFYWVPFAVGAYLVEHRKHEHARRAWRKLVHPIRHIQLQRHAATGAA